MMKRILLMSKKGKGKSALTAFLLEGEECEITWTDRAVTGKEAFMASPYDLIIINTPLSDEFGDDIACEASRKTDAGVIAIIDNRHIDRLAKKMEKAGVMVAGKPMIKGIFLQAVNFAQAVKPRIKALQEENERLHASLESVKAVNRAKWVLVKYFSMSEEQAHRYIEKQAMDRQVSKEDIAGRILKTYRN